MSKNPMLNLSANLQLPMSAVTETFAILARRGRGKSYLADVLAEEMLEAKQLVVIIDPVGAHHGLRSSADGKSAGYPIVVLGGDHGDIPLDQSSGEVVAQAIVDHRFSAILDLSLFRKGEAIRFVTAFLESLFRLNRDPVHLIIDEADQFAPKFVSADVARCCGALQDIYKLARQRGIGATCITQRPQALHNAVLSQAASLFVLGMSHPRDIDAIDDWVKVHATDEERDKVVAELPTMPVGTAWFWSPEWIQTLKKIEVRKRRTFDSGATPKPGETRRVPKKLAKIDLAALGEKMKAAADTAKANDPKALKAEVVALRSKLAQLEQAPSQIQVQPVGHSNDAVMAILATRDQEWKEYVTGVLGSLRDRLVHAVSSNKIELPLPKVKLPKKLGWKVCETGRFSSSLPSSSEIPRAKPSSPPPAVRSPPSRGSTGSADLTNPQRTLLRSLAWWRAMGHDEPTRPQAAAIAGWKPNGSNLKDRLSELSKAGLVDYPWQGAVRLTPAGISAAPDPDTSVTLIDSIKSILTGPQLKLFEAMLVGRDTVLSRQELAQSVGWEPNGSNLKDRLSELSRLEIVDYPVRGHVALQKWVTQ